MNDHVSKEFFHIYVNIFRVHIGYHSDSKSSWHLNGGISFGEAAHALPVGDIAGAVPSVPWWYHAAGVCREGGTWRSGTWSFHGFNLWLLKG